jgi:hypothetical protein
MLALSRRAKILSMATASSPHTYAYDAREHVRRLLESALNAHVRAADLHKEAADFHELHAAGERSLGRIEKAQEMEKRADRERERADHARATLGGYES